MLDYPLPTPVCRLAPGRFTLTICSLHQEELRVARVEAERVKAVGAAAGEKERMRRMLEDAERERKAAGEEAKRRRRNEKQVRIYSMSDQ
jgi:hypothetical protein